MNQFDVIVVGAGNGGLTAATTLAKAGLRTIVFEKHNLPGGCATSFVRGRFEFEAALHELCNRATSDKQDSVDKIFERLGVDVGLLYEENLFRAIVKGEDGYDVTIRPGYEGFLDSMEEAVPGCRESVRQFIDLIGELDAAQDFIDESGIRPLTLYTKFGDFMRVAAHSVNDIMDVLEIPKKAQHILGTYWGYLGVPTDDLNALHYISLLAAFVKTPPSMPFHRSHELSLAMVQALQSYGGEIRYNSEVTRFLFNKKGEATGVIVNGRICYAKKIISNIIPHNVFNRMKNDVIPTPAKKLANARKFGMTFVTVYLGLDCTMEELGITDYSLFISAEADTRKQFERRGDFGMYVVNCLNKAIPDASPAGTSMLFFTIPYMPGDFPEDLKPQDYKAFKNAVAEKYIRDYEQTLGIHVMEHIEEIVVATPATFARYLATPEGAIYGYSSETWDNVVGRTALMDLENKIPNLHFCGGHAARGDGYPSAYITGAMAADAVLSELGRKEA